MSETLLVVALLPTVTCSMAYTGIVDQFLSSDQGIRQASWVQNCKCASPVDYINFSITSPLSAAHERTKLCTGADVATPTRAAPVQSARCGFTSGTTPVRRGTEAAVLGAGAGAGCVRYDISRRAALPANPRRLPASRRTLRSSLLISLPRRLGGWRWPHFPEAARRALWRGRMGAERKLRVLTTALLLGGWRWPPDTSNEGRTVFHHVRARVVVEQDQHPGANPSLRQASARAWLRKTGGRICSTGTSVCACSHSIRRGRRR